MFVLKIIGKIVAIPVLLVISLVWLVVKVMTAIYGLCYGILGIGVTAALVLFLAYQEWANVVAIILIATVAFTVLFAGTFIQIILEEANKGLLKIIKA